MENDTSGASGLLNPSSPLKLNAVKLSGFAASTAFNGEKIKVLERSAMTSESLIFHRIGRGIIRTLQTACEESGHRVQVERASRMLAIIKPDESADLYLDSADIVVQARVKDACERGQAVLENDLIDILSADFPDVAIEQADQVIFVFREGFRFGLYFDLSREFERADMTKALGALMRQTSHSEAYSALTNTVIYEAMNMAGWFPFIEIQKDEFFNIYLALVESRDLEKVERNLISAFSRERLEKMFGRWMGQPNFKKREGLLRPGIEAFLSGEPVGAIKTLSTEIEGILQEAHVASKSRSAKTSGLIDFAVSEASRKAGGPDTLFFADAFKGYLKENVYQAFDPVTGNASAWRHGAAHGAAPVETYTMKRALQVILTLDQLYAYLL